MEKYITWYILWLKAYVKKISYWLQVLGMVFLLFVLSSISMPDSENVTVGICYGKSGWAERIAGQLAEGESLFTFKSYDSEEALYRDVTAGRAECGFVFCEDFDGRVESGDLQGAVIYLATPLTVKGEVARETVYAALVRNYSEEILKNSEKQIYGEENSERTAEILAWNEFFSQGENVFRLEVETIDTGYREEAEEASDGATYPIQGMTGVFVFLIMFLAYGRQFGGISNAVEKALNGKERLLYAYSGMIAAGTLPAAAGSAVILLLTGAVEEILLMLLFLLISGIWIVAVGGLMRRGTSFLSGAAAVTVIGMLICPVFVNWNMYVPALKYVSCIFPLGIYLNLHMIFL